MTVPELINEVLNNLRNQYYADRVRDFKRDERALMKAIARYGYECNRRGWLFQVEFIFRELMALLLKIRTSGAEIGYLPIYLEGAVDKHIRTRAEELSAEARKPANITRRAIGDVKAVTVVAPAAVEVMDALYRDLKRRRRKSAPVKERQEALL